LTNAMAGQVSLLDLDSWSGKTFPERSAATKEKTSALSLKKQPGLQTKPLLYLDLRKANGILADASWETVGQLPGESWTLNTGESPKDAVESSLSQILEDNPHPKYFLSAKACQGILRRAEKRGKELPLMLKEALERQSQSTATAKIVDSSSLGGVVPTIPAKAGTGGNNGPMLAIPTKVYGICSYASNSMKSDNPHSGIYEAETSRTLDLNGGSPACNQGGMAIVQTYSFQRSDEFKETDKTSTQSRRQYKDATDLAVGIDAYNHQTTGDKACTFTANSGSSPTHSDPMVATVDCRNLYENQELSATLQSKPNGGQSLNYINPVRQRYSVRRLTPLECERLQGFPDGWTDIPGQTEASKEELEFWRDVWLTWDKTQAEDPEKVKPRTDKAILKWLKNPVSDSAQYKALGNSVAVPCPEYVLEGIKEVLEVAHEK
jgi:site-specific DNA-cytosine methylase